MTLGPGFGLELLGSLIWTRMGILELLPALEGSTSVGALPWPLRDMAVCPDHLRPL